MKWGEIFPETVEKKIWWQETFSTNSGEKNTINTMENTTSAITVEKNVEK